MYLLDTDILSMLQRGDERIAARIQACEESVSTSVVSFAEIVRARCERLLKAADHQQLLTAQYWLDESLRFLDAFRILRMERQAADVFVRLNQDNAVRKIGRADVLIARIALANRATLVTNNRRHFAVVPGLALANWAE